MRGFFSVVSGWLSADWRKIVADLAHFYHWPPSELWGLSLSDATLFSEQAGRISDEMAEAMKAS